jgi:hypothetical protein
VLARGCITRLTVLTGGGNLRALTGLWSFRDWRPTQRCKAFRAAPHEFATVTVSPSVVSLGDLPGGPWAWSAALAAALVLVALRSGAGRWALVGAAALGALVRRWPGSARGLFSTTISIRSRSRAVLHLPWAETLFWSIASSLTAPAFGTGLIGGVLAGAVAAALLSGRFAWEGFESPRRWAGRCPARH